MPKDAFIDPIKELADYTWEWGHETEDPQTETLNLERSALTTGEGFVRQQGAPSPRTVKLRGTCRTPAQKVAMEAFYNACAGKQGPPRTVIWQDFEAGSLHEVLITEWSPVREPGKLNGYNFVYKYTITMELLT